MPRLLATDEDRFSWKVKPSADGCWDWQGAISANGYGRFKFHGKNQYAHRVALYFLGHALSDDVEVDHLCENRCCVNPTHLDVVSHLENVRRILHP